MGFIFSYKIIVRVIYSGVFKGRQVRHLPRAPLSTVMCKVAYLAFKGAQQQLQCMSGLLCFQRGPQQQLQRVNTLISKGPKETVMHFSFTYF